MEDKLAEHINEIIRLYTEDKLGHTTIANMYGVDSATIKSRLIKNGIEIDKNTRFGDRKKRNKYPVCSVEGCDNKSNHMKNGIYYCKRHFGQIVEYGKILNRTKFDKNEIRDIGGYIEMDLYDSRHNVVKVCYFDKDKLELLSGYKWLEDKQGYVVTKDDNRRRISMHRLIMNLTPNDKGVYVDHINLIKHDNRISNLRIANDSTNEMNKTINSKNSSGVKGVSLYSKDNKWRGEIVKDKIKYRDVFEYFDDAVKFRISKEALLFKNFSYLYNHDTQTVQLTYHSHDDNKQTFIEVNMDGQIIKFEKLSQ